MKSYEISLLALLIWREARGEEINAKIGVGHSVVNRVNSKRWFGKNFLDVMFKPFQYSSLTDPKDKQLTIWPKDDETWQSCVSIAQGIAAGLYESPIGDCTHYHDTSIGLNPPAAWGKCEFVIQLGRIRFYRGIK